MATETRYTFQPEDIRRIADAVRAHERRTIHGGGGGFVRGQVQQFHIGKTDTAIVKGYTGVISLWRNLTPSNTSGGIVTSGSDTGINVIACNLFASVAANVWVAIYHDGQAWFLVAAEC